VSRLLVALVVVAIAVTVVRPAASSPYRWRSLKGAMTVGVSLLLLPSALFFAFGDEGAVQTARNPPRTPLCTASTPHICIWPEDRKYLPALSAMSRRMSQLPPGLVTVRSEFEADGLRSADPSGTGGFDLPSGSLWEAATDLSLDILSSTFPGTCVPNGAAAQNAFTIANFTVATWLEDRLFGASQPSGVHGGPPDVNVQRVAAVVAKPNIAQVNWVHREYKIIRQPPCEG
jgi:hypothetical protein